MQSHPPRPLPLPLPLPLSLPLPLPLTLPLTLTLTLALALPPTLGACSLTPPPRSPEDEQAVRAVERRQHEAAEAQAALAQERAEFGPASQALRAELEQIDAGLQAQRDDHRRRTQAHADYQARITEAQAFADGCDALGKDDPVGAGERGFALAEGLAGYVAEPSRDAALDALDACRRSLQTPARKRIKQTIVDLRRDYAVEIEDSFDANNPYSRGDLSTTISGSKLSVRMRGNFEGRARHSQEQVDAWCAGAWGLFSTISLKNAHGQFSCEPEGSSKALTEGVLEEAKLSQSWRAPAGDQPTPQAPGDPPTLAPELAQRRAAIEAELAGFAERDAGFEDRQRQLDVTTQQASNDLARAERDRQAEVEGWGQQALKQAGQVQTAGTVIASVGGVILLGTVGATQLGVGSSRLLIVGAGVSVPMLLTGVALSIAGSVRKSRLRKALAAP